MDVGQMKDRITIERNEGEKNGAGEIIPKWVTVKRVWANVRFERGMEAIRNDKDTTIKRASMRIRKRDDIDESMRVIFRRDTFNIHSILPVDNDRTYMDLVVESQL